VASLALPSHKLSPCLWHVPCLLLSDNPCAQSQGTCLFVPTVVLVACVYLCSSCEHGLIFTQLVDSSNGHWWWCYGQWCAHWCQTQAMVTGSLVDDGLDHWWMMAWMSGSLDNWWMMFALPCWYCACARYCDIPLVSLRNWSLVQSFTMTVFVFVGYPSPTFHWHLKLRTVLMSMRVI